MPGRINVFATLGATAACQALDQPGAGKGKGSDTDSGNDQIRARVA